MVFSRPGGDDDLAGLVSQVLSDTAVVPAVLRLIIISLDLSQTSLELCWGNVRNIHDSLQRKEKKY